jgi:tRNA threonylcarbamoyladenosine biosynthesis protein TsaE
VVERAAGGRTVLCEQGVGLDRLEQIGRGVARLLSPGDVVLMYGPLGSGKTTLVRMIARALGTAEPIRSPSFTIANVYSGRVSILHLDLFRLDCIDDSDALVLEEYVRPDAVTLVEWPQAGLERLGEPAWTIHLHHESLNRRSVLVEASTPEAARRWEAGQGFGE